MRPLRPHGGDADAHKRVRTYTQKADAVIGCPGERECDANAGRLLARLPDLMLMFLVFRLAGLDYVGVCVVCTITIADDATCNALRC